MNDTHAALREQLAELDKAAAALEPLLTPLRAALNGIEEARALILEANSAEIASKCEGCGSVIFRGEPCHHNDVDLCEACAPTWGDIKAIASGPDAADHFEDEDGPARCLAEIDQHLAAGGSLDDKCVGPA